MEAFNYIALGVGVAGSIIIIWGVLITMFNFLRNEKDNLVNKKLPNISGALRYQFSGYLILGLDFMLAADMIHTIHKPQLTDM